MPKIFNKKDPYFIDFPRRVEQIQIQMAIEKIDIYLGSRLRTTLVDIRCLLSLEELCGNPARGTTYGLHLCY